MYYSAEEMRQSQLLLPKFILQEIILSNFFIFLTIFILVRRYDNLTETQKSNNTYQGIKIQNQSTKRLNFSCQIQIKLKQVLHLSMRTT